MVYYECQCGCLVTAEELLRIKNPRTSGFKLVCLHHPTIEGGHITKKFTTCSVCDKRFQISLTGAVPLQCSECHVYDKINTEEIEKLHDKLTECEIDIIPGEVINFYECGCIIHEKYDPDIRAYYNNGSLYKRTCPYHTKGFRLVSRYKQCKTCGSVVTGVALRSSKYCMHCWPRQKSKSKLLYSKPVDNSDLCDINRSDCRNRDKCLIKYIEYETIPCKNCNDYDPGKFIYNPYLQKDNPERLCFA